MLTQCGVHTIYSRAPLIQLPPSPLFFDSGLQYDPQHFGAFGIRLTHAPAPPAFSCVYLYEIVTKTLNSKRTSKVGVFCVRKFRAMQYAKHCGSNVDATSAVQIFSDGCVPQLPSSSITVYSQTADSSKGCGKQLPAKQTQSGKTINWR